MRAPLVKAATFEGSCRQIEKHSLDKLGIETIHH